MRFRRFPVAVVCDIAEMYLQIGTAAEDKPYHRFRWRGIQQNQQPDVYEFDRVVFGVKLIAVPGTVRPTVSRQEISAGVSNGCRDYSQIDVHGRFNGFCVKRGAGHKVI